MPICGAVFAYEQKDLQNISVYLGQIVCPACFKELTVNSWFENEPANMSWDM